MLTKYKTVEFVSIKFYKILEKKEGKFYLFIF